MKTTRILAVIVSLLFLCNIASADTFKLWTRGSAVTKLQKELGFQRGDVDGIYGPKTRSADRAKTVASKPSVELVKTPEKVVAAAPQKVISQAPTSKPTFVVTDKRPLFFRWFQHQPKTLIEQTPAKASFLGKSNLEDVRLTCFQAGEGCYENVKIKKGKNKGKTVRCWVNHSDKHTDALESSTGLQLCTATENQIGVAAVIPSKTTLGSLIKISTSKGLRLFLAADNPKPESHSLWMENVRKNARTAAEADDTPIDLYAKSLPCPEFTSVEIVPYTGKTPFMKLSLAEKRSYLNPAKWGISFSHKLPKGYPVAVR